MYRKIISNLSFSPAAIDQVSFYARRLKQEESVRRLGLVLIVLSMIVQVFAAMVPPERSLAASGNDVVYGGVSNIDQLRNKYNSQADVRALYNRFGINAGDLTNRGANLTSFKFQEQGSRGTKTVGRINFGSTQDHNLGRFAGTTFYSRSAAEWQGSTPAFYFGKHKGTDNRYFHVWVLKDCGNIAFRPTDAPTQAIISPIAPKPIREGIISQPAPKPAPAPATVVTPPPPTPTPPPTPVPPTPETPPPVLQKTAVNVTQGLTAEQTQATPARGGDVIEYSLITKNPGTTARTNYLVEDYIGDILDYANLDQNLLASQGVTYSVESKTISWPGQTVPARGELKKVFQVVLKPIVPSTNSPNATAPDYDCKMQNGYGNEVVVPVDCSVLKTVEELPNTGPGTTVAAALGVSVVSYYFFMRSRLLSKEIGIIKKSYQSGS